MNLIVCLDDRNGISFFGRRQSMDRILRERALQLAKGGPLWMDSYTAGQFDNAGICVDDDYLRNAPEDAWCFMELGDPEKLMNRVGKLAVFHWNREYPADRRFPFERFVGTKKPVMEENFEGYSHPQITLEVYHL